MCFTCTILVNYPNNHRNTLFIWLNIALHDMSGFKDRWDYIWNPALTLNLQNCEPCTSYVNLASFPFFTCILKLTKKCLIGCSEDYTLWSIYNLRQGTQQSRHSINMSSKELLSLSLPPLSRPYTYMHTQFHSNPFVSSDCFSFLSRDRQGSFNKIKTG